MIRPLNDWEMTLGMRCGAASGCGQMATHCDPENTHEWVFLCTAHAVELAMLHGGKVKTEPAEHAR